MAQYRQSGAERYDFRGHHDLRGAADNRIPHNPARIRRASKAHPRRPPLATVVAVSLSLVLLLTLAAFRRLSGIKEGVGVLNEDESKSELGFVWRINGAGHVKELQFGHGSVGKAGRDSRYWDRDDRRRDQHYGEDDLQKGRILPQIDQISGSVDNGNEKLLAGDHQQAEGRNVKGGVLYNEGGRKELDSYKEEYDAALNRGRQLDHDNGTKEDDPDDEYDDGTDVPDDQDDNAIRHDHGGEDLGGGSVAGSQRDVTSDTHSEALVEANAGDGGKKENRHAHAGNDGGVKLSGSQKKSSSKRKSKRHKYSSSTCEMKYLNSTAQLVEPVVNKKFARFSLQYTGFEERPAGSEDWVPRFAGHQTLQEREDSYYARDKKINCGFVKGPDGFSTGFDIAEDDKKYMRGCHIAVSSCIFGNSDRLRTPFGKTITRLSRKNVCFAMFLDESTLQTLLSEGQEMDSTGFIGLWKMIMVKNLPSSDMRRVGKIPKFLAHRLFPSARYSIWLDSKLRLQSDPLLILDYFLWRHGHEYAISNHYDRHCVWEEVAQNKKLNKFNHTIIDQQFVFYQADGLKKFDHSDPNKLLPSYVPEGSFIVREHTPMSNLFSCLWFNEVDRFTPRDQLSFAYTFLKLGRMNPGKSFHLNMFKDCERRAIAKLFHHRAEEKPSNPSPLTR